MADTTTNLTKNSISIKISRLEDPTERLMALWSRMLSGMFIVHVQVHLFRTGPDLMGSQTTCSILEDPCEVYEGVFHAAKFYSVLKPLR